MTATRFFASSAALQDYLLEHAGPGTLGVIPHQRLAHQVWHRQRLAAFAAGRPAWEPVALRTLNAWWGELCRGLWLDQALPPALVRLALWRQALQAAPPLASPTSTTTWTQALDEAHALLSRYGVPVGPPGPDDAPLVTWRRRVTGVYTDLLRQGGWLNPGELPAQLTAALQAGRLRLPQRLLVAGLETPAPVEHRWLEAVSRHLEVIHLKVTGDLKNVEAAKVLPDPGQEVAWVAARLVELAREGVPLHRLAVTAMDLDAYLPQLRRVLAELLGPAQAPGGWSYNFSQGPALAAVPLFQAALLPLKFIAAGERREDLVALLLSPYYGAGRGRLGEWDRLFRERRVDQGWSRLKAAVSQSRDAAADAAMLRRLDQSWASLRLPASTAGQWRRGLEAAWRELGFPQGLDGGETEAWERLLRLLSQLDAALGSEALGVGEFLEWLTLGARRILLPGPGIQPAGIQILGLLEMRGLDFSRVFCLGMNSGTLPAPPRVLPLLTPGEKRRVLGGTHLSQHHFAAELFASLLGTAPHLTLTRPKAVDQEERVGTPLYGGAWDPAAMAVLSVPHPAWLRSPAIRAGFAAPAAPAWPTAPEPTMAWPLPGELSLSGVRTALGCPCRFLLEILLKIRELPEIDAGLDPRERGQALHQVLARFTTAFQELLAAEQSWDEARARELLAAAARQALAPVSFDLHWQAEGDRWLGPEGLLWEWLQREQERFEQGWRWLGMEAPFKELRAGDWPFTLAGRIDRLDHHPATGTVVVWDYKTGQIPQAAKVLEEPEECQLPCYLLAVQSGRVAAARDAAGVRAGFIGLKSSLAKHVRHEDFKASPEQWRAAAAVFAAQVADLGRRLQAGDFRPAPSPAPSPAPAGTDLGACRYCPYALVCGLTPEPDAPVEEAGD